MSRHKPRPAAAVRGVPCDACGLDPAGRIHDAPAPAGFFAGSFPLVHIGRQLETHGPRKNRTPNKLLAAAWQPGMRVSSHILAAYLLFRDRGSSPAMAHHLAVWTYPTAQASLQRARKAWAI